jgi:predicted Zn-dependent protease
MDDTITINKGQLQVALAEWERQSRMGECISREETVALPLDEVASENAEHLWGLLQAEVIG